MRRFGEALRQWARETRWQSKALCQQAQHQRNLAHLWWRQREMRRAQAARLEERTHA